MANQDRVDWLRMLVPDGLVVSAPVIDELDLWVRQPLEVVHALRDATEGDRLPDLDTLAALLGWGEHLDAAPEDARLDLPDLGATVQASHRACDRRGELLAWVRWTDEDLDRAPRGSAWIATPTERFERLLGHLDHPVGLLVTPTQVRLLYAPPGEAPGRLTFPIDALRSPDGRLLVDALHMLLGSARLITPRRGKGLLDVLRASRARQESVTDQLARQVQDALEVLLEGFDRADRRTDGALLRDVSAAALYDGLTTALLRLVFLLYAEDRGLLPMDHAVYQQHYSVAALGEQLAEDAVAHGEGQSRRFGAWARVLSLSRMIYAGVAHHGMRLPPRQGELFDPHAHPFLEGRPAASQSDADPVAVPPVDDATLHGVLQRLLHLDGQRISYRNLEVEQLGSVYEALMGFEVRRAATPAVRLKSRCWVELGALVDAEEPYLTLQDLTGERNARLRKTVPALASLRSSGDARADADAVADALAPLRAERAPLPAGRHYLQPGSARRGSGSHYTPRALTAPLVRRALAPLLGEAPTPEQIEALRICDPAMGSGAFLAEVVRQLGDALLAAWARAGSTPTDGDVDPLIRARRRVAERCVYGVDKNPRATMLARLSMWLITSAADLPFTFVDHNLKSGDALVGLSLEQVAGFALEPDGSPQLELKGPVFRSVMQSAIRLRAEITAEQQKLVFPTDEHRRQRSFLRMSDDETWDERRVGDLLLACAWDANKTAYVRRRKAMDAVAWSWYPNPERAPLPEPAQALLDALPMRPFHWWLEFPEVFARAEPGFDAVVGNPPFGGKNTIVAENGEPYIKLLQSLWPHAHGNADLAAYFFLQTAQILRPGGHFGLVASNTIKQGDTLNTGLRHLVNERGVTLTAAETDLPWPVKGVAVVVDRVSGTTGEWDGPCLLNGEPVDAIHSGLGAGEELPEPVKLAANAGRCFQGSNVLGKGFVLEPDEALALIAEDPRRAEVLRPYQGGRELNNNVPATPDAFIPCSRYVIDFGDRSLEEAAQWPVLLERVRRLVKPERDRLKDNPDGRRRKRYWWMFGRSTPGLEAGLDGLERCLALTLVSKYLLLAFQERDCVFSHKLAVTCSASMRDFAVLQSKVHEAWAWASSSTMKKDLNYTPSRCFETFPFPRPSPAQADAMARAGDALHRARAEVMVDEQLGMTAVWNRVHDPHDHDPAIERLRALRDAMDRAVLDAYGWSDLSPDDGPAIVARLRKLNALRAAEEAALRGEVPDALPAALETWPELGKAPTLEAGAWAMLRAMALVRVAGAPLPRTRLARAMALLDAPKQLTAEAPKELKARAREWAKAARGLPKAAPQLQRALTHLCDVGALRRRVDGDAVVIEATEGTPELGELGGWVVYEGRLAAGVG